MNMHNPPQTGGNGHGGGKGKGAGRRKSPRTPKGRTRAVADRLAASVMSAPRDVWIIYVHPEHRRVFDESKAWMEVACGEFHVVLRSHISA